MAKTAKCRLSRVSCQHRAWRPHISSVCAQIRGRYDCYLFISRSSFFVFFRVVPLFHSRGFLFLRACPFGNSQKLSSEGRLVTQCFSARAGCVVATPAGLFWSFKRRIGGNSCPVKRALIEGAQVKTPSVSSIVSEALFLPRSLRAAAVWKQTSGSAGPCGSLRVCGVLCSPSVPPGCWQGADFLWCETSGGWRRSRVLFLYLPAEREI